LWRRLHWRIKGAGAALVEDLVATLNGFKAGNAEQQELLGLLAPMKGEIVEVDSDATGTPLPASYKPAPAMVS
jgi:hemoglobin